MQRLRIAQPADEVHQAAALGRVARAREVERRRVVAPADLRVRARPEHERIAADLEPEVAPARVDVRAIDVDAGAVVGVRLRVRERTAGRRAKSP